MAWRRPAPTAGLRWRAPESEIAPKEGEVTQTLSLRNSRIKGAAALRPWLVRMRVRILYADHGMSSQNGSNESSNLRLSEQLLSMEISCAPNEVKALMTWCPRHYNIFRQHGSLAKRLQGPGIERAQCWRIDLRPRRTAVRPSTQLRFGLSQELDHATSEGQGTTSAMSSSRSRFDPAGRPKPGYLEDAVH